MGHPKLPQVGGKEIQMKHGAIKDIIEKLEKDLRRLKNARLTDDIQDHSPSQAAMGNYAAGKGLSTTVDAAESAIGGTYDTFITAYENVIMSLRNSEANTRDADDNSTHSLRKVGGGRFTE